MPASTGNREHVRIDGLRRNLRRTGEGVPMSFDSVDDFYRWFGGLRIESYRCSLLSSGIVSAELPTRIHRYIIETKSTEQIGNLVMFSIARSRISKKVTLEANRR
jgi:hypothetical protein